jgi:hypothetical protein
MNYVGFYIVCTAQIVIIKISFCMNNFLNFTPHTFENAASTPMIHLHPPAPGPQHGHTSQTLHFFLLENSKLT